MGVPTSMWPFFLMGAVVFSTVDLSSAATPTLSTHVGDVTGLVKQVSGKDIEVFYGVRYAKPPLGMYRIGLPNPVMSGNTIPGDGTVKPAACWQPIDTAFDRFEGVEMWNPDTEMSEDCLYLNVWRPAQRDGPKPIMIWIHGGGFLTGSAVLDAYEGSVLAAKKDVILVTIAYRLGALGFFFDGQMTGNAGLFDQAVAIEFVHTNAARFGGSPDDITLFGEEAGAASIGFHLMNHVSRDKFSRVIMQSASPLSPWALGDRKVLANRTLTMLANLGCVQASDKPADLMAFFDCMRAQSAEDMTAEIVKMTGKWYELPLPPMVDKFQLKDEPMKVLKSGEIKLTDVIIGVNKNEGIYKGVYVFKEDLPLAKKGKMRSKTRFRDMILTIADGDEDLKTKLLKRYHRESVLKNRRLEILDAAIGDSQYKCSVVDFAREYTKRGGRVFLYSFEENFSTNPWPDWMGVTQRSEIEVVFGAPLKGNSGNTEEEIEVSKTMMGLWTSFAENGTPTYKNEELPVFTLENEEYVIIDAQGIRTDNFLRKKACALWHNHQYPNENGEGSGLNERRTFQRWID